MHGLFLSRRCRDITELSHELMGLHCWFHRNVVFSSLIRGADISGWKTALTKTWLYRGTLHGVTMQDLPHLLALHTGPFRWGEPYEEIAGRALSLMEDGVYSRSEMRRIFAHDYPREVIAQALSPWGGVFVWLARQGRVAFRDMTSRDFDLIDAEPDESPEEVLPDLFRRYIKAYGPATLADAALFLGLRNERQSELTRLKFDSFLQFEYERRAYYYLDDDDEEPGDIPPVTLLAGFDPYIVSYEERSAVLPPEYRSAVILKSGICLPTIEVNGQVAGLWNIKKGEPYMEFFKTPPKAAARTAAEMIDRIGWETGAKF